MQRAVIFDCDGLIVDTETPAFEAWQTIFHEAGVELALERWVACVGAGYGRFDPVDELARLTGRPWDRAATFARKDALKRALCAELPALPGVSERLSEAEALGWRIGVASSSAAPHVRGHLERLGLLGRVHALSTGDEVSAVKPDPALYLLAAERLGVEPAACVVLEDSLNGVLAGRAAGMYAIAVPNAITRGLDFSAAQLQVSSLAALRLEGLPLA